MQIFYKAAIALVIAFMRTVYRPTAITQDGTKNRLIVDDPTIIVANHTSYLDALFLFSSFKGKGRLRMLVARDWFDKKSVHWIINAAGGIPCDRKGLDTQWLREAVDAIRGGESVLIFPEGRTRRDGEMNDFKSGFAMLSAMTGAPVLPVGLSGQYKPFRRTHFTVGDGVTLERRGAADPEYLRGESAEVQGTVDRLRRDACGI